MKNKRLYTILVLIGLILMVPLVAMQFTNEVNWSLLDFIVAAFLLLSTAIVCEVILRNIKTMKMRILLSFVLLILLVLIWAELAVGIFGTPFAGN